MNGIIFLGTEKDKPTIVSNPSLGTLILCKEEGKTGYNSEP